MQTHYTPKQVSCQMAYPTILRTMVPRVEVSETDAAAYAGMCSRRRRDEECKDLVLRQRPRLAPVSGGAGRASRGLLLRPLARLQSGGGHFGVIPL